MHVTFEWIGNSPNVAVKHYWQGTDDPFGQSAMDGALQNRVQHSSAPDRAKLHGVLAPRPGCFENGDVRLEAAQ